MAWSCHHLVNIITRELTVRQGAGGFPWRRLSVPRSVSMQVMGTATWPKGVKKKTSMLTGLARIK